jgi:hypothetical protein
MQAPPWSVRVTRSADEPSTRVFVRKHQFAIGSPVSFDEEHPAVTALEYALGALGGELLSGFLETAKRRRADVDQLEAVVQGEVENPLVHLGVVGASGSPRLARVGIKVYVNSLEEEDVLQSIWADVLARAVLLKTLEPTVKVELSFKAT